MERDAFYDDDGGGRGEGGCWDCCKLLCNILCCPPIPHRIIAKFAFQPPLTSYEFRSTDGRQPETSQQSSTSDGNGIGLTLWHLSPFAPHSQDLLPFAAPVETHIITDIRTRRGNTLSAVFLEHPSAQRTILFSHGNAVDIGVMAPFMVDLVLNLECSVFFYDYSGYGLSTGRPREANLYSDIAAAFACLTERLGVPADQIILYGQSIGTVATVDLASRRNDVAGVVLHSPLSSGLRVMRPNCSRTLWCDPFPSINKVERIHAPVLVIHGTEDEVIPFSHGRELHERCPGSNDPLWIDGAGHNNIEAFPSYIGRLQQFIDSIPPQSQPQSQLQ